jgi:hypothetical protein
MPLVASIRQQLEAAYAGARNADLRAKAVAFAADYDASRVTLEHWVPVLEKLGCSSTLPAESRQARRARERRERKKTAAVR